MKWLHLALIAAASALILALLLLLTLKKLNCFRRNNNNDAAERGGHTLQSGITRLHQVSPAHNQLDKGSSKKTNHLFGPGPSNKRAFSWADHPSLVTDAVENGWSRFAFTTSSSLSSSPSPSVKSARSLLGVFTSSGANPETNSIEIGWEVCEGSSDFMQKIRLNPLTKKKKMNASLGSGSWMGAACVIRGALPLPGPNLGNSSFPQEAYFEITILSCNENALDHQLLEGDKIKLIGDASPDCVGISSHSERERKVEQQVKLATGKRGDQMNELVSISVGFTVAGGGGGALPLRIPGSYQGSIGFNSTGSLCLDGQFFSPLLFFSFSFFFYFISLH